MCSLRCAHRVPRWRNGEPTPRMNEIAERIKNWIATLTGGEQAPNDTAAAEKFRTETQREQELAAEQEEAQRERMETRGEQETEKEAEVPMN